MAAHLGSWSWNLQVFNWWINKSLVHQCFLFSSSKLWAGTLNFQDLQFQDSSRTPHAEFWNWDCKKQMQERALASIIFWFTLAGKNKGTPPPSTLLLFGGLPSVLWKEWFTERGFSCFLWGTGATWMKQQSRKWWQKDLVFKLLFWPSQSQNSPKVNPGTGNSRNLKKPSLEKLPQIIPWHFKVS